MEGVAGQKESQQNSISSIRVKFSVHTDVGKVRSENQDAYAYAIKKNAALFIVADGMGGANGGKTASTLAVNSLIKDAFDKSQLITRNSLASAIIKANLLINKNSKEDPLLEGMGTTLVALAICQGKAWIAHVGDSRIYYLDKNEQTQLTKDHTLVQELLDSGSISDDQASGHPIGHVLTRSLGPGDDLEVEVREVSDLLQPGSKFLLCCDGLYNSIAPNLFKEVFGSASTESLPESLVDLANEGGGIDNITVMVIEALPEGAPAILEQEEFSEKIDLGISEEPGSKPSPKKSGSSPASELLFSGSHPTKDEVDAHQEKFKEKKAEQESKKSNSQERTTNPNATRADKSEDEIDLGEEDGEVSKNQNIWLIRSLIGVLVVLLMSVFAVGGYFVAVKYFPSHSLTKKVYTFVTSFRGSGSEKRASDMKYFEDITKNISKDSPAKEEKKIIAEVETAEVVDDQKLDLVDSILSERSLSKEDILGRVTLDEQREDIYDFSVYPAPQIVDFESGSMPSEAVKWEKEKAKKEKIINSSAELGNDDATLNPTNLSEVDSLSVHGKKAKLRSEIEGVDFKLSLFHFKKIEEAQAKETELNEEKKKINIALEQIAKEESLGKSRISAWKEYQQKLAQGQLAMLAERLSKFNEQALIAKSNYERLAVRYRDAVSKWSANTNDQELASEMTTLGNDLRESEKSIRGVLERVIGGGIEEEANLLQKLEVDRQLLKEKSDRLNIYLGLLDAWRPTIVTSLANESQARLLSERASMLAELKELNIQLSDQQELAVLREQTVSN